MNIGKQHWETLIELRIVKWITIDKEITQMIPEKYGKT
jgi:hypothetical protein